MLLIVDGRTIALTEAPDLHGCWWLSAEELRAQLGWDLKPQGLCVDEATCIPVPTGSALIDGERVDLAAVAAHLGRPLVIAAEHGIAALGGRSGPGSGVLQVERGQVVLDRIDGGRLDLAELRGRKVLLAAWASWCLCRHDLEGWEAEHRALSASGLEVVSVALDRSADEARPWVAAAGATHLACVDPGHRVAQVFGLVNVPSVVWLDEGGAVVRPADTQFATEAGARVSGLDWQAARTALRAWVLRGELRLDAADHVREAGAEEERARAHWALAEALLERGERGVALRHLDAAGEAAPHDFTIRRAGLVLRGEDPFGLAYWQMRQELLASGGEVYRPLPDWQEFSK